MITETTYKYNSDNDLILSENNFFNTFKTETKKARRETKSLNYNSILRDLKIDKL
jgi:hypothetical protein